MIRFDSWWNNFRTIDEQYFAACVLDAFIYRSEPQTIALMRQLLQRVLPDLLRVHAPDMPRGSKLIEALQNDAKAAQHRLRFVPVIRSKDKPTKSGYVISRLYHRKLGVGEKWIIQPTKLREAIAEGARTLVFIDDFLGTGTQFTGFAEEYEISRIHSSVTCLYAPLVAHSVGVSNVEGRLKRVRVAMAESINPSFGLFDRSAPWFQDQVNSHESARRFYFRMMRQNKIGSRENFREGFGKLALAYSFSHGIPNNCLPMFWAGSTTWQAFLQR